MNRHTTITTDEALRVANARIAELHLEARNERLADRGRPRRWFPDAVRSALSSVRGEFAAIDEASLAVPRLADYPYRS